MFSFYSLSVVNILSSAGKSSNVDLFLELGFTTFRLANKVRRVSRCQKKTNKVQKDSFPLILLKYSKKYSHK